MRIGFDIMGGDYAPLEAIKGAILAQKELPSDVRIVLFGDESQAKQLLAENQILQSMHATTLFYALQKLKAF